VRCFDALVHLVQVGALLHVAELLLDRLDLLVEVILALALLHLPLDSSADSALDLQNVQFGFHERQQMLETLPDFEHFQYRLLLLEFERQVRRHGICQPAGLVDA